MNGRPTTGGSTWADPDDAPELTDEHFERADIYDGETQIRRGRAPGKSSHEASRRFPDEEGGR